MFHIISYILPFFIASRGNLWRYSSAKLESRGGRVKRVARAVVCWQPRGVYTRTIKRSRKGGAEASNRKTIRVQNTNCGSKNILDRLVLAENLMRAGSVRPKQAKRFAETGRLKKVRELTKARSLDEDRIHLELTSLAVFEAMYDNTIPLIYTESGKLNPDYASAGASFKDL